MIPEEDKFIERCEHNWVDLYNGSGLSKQTPDKMIVVFFCKKCLATRHKIIDVSEMIVSPETLDLYED